MQVLGHAYTLKTVEVACIPLFSVCAVILYMEGVPVSEFLTNQYQLLCSLSVVIQLKYHYKCGSLNRMSFGGRSRLIRD